MAAIEQPIIDLGGQWTLAYCDGAEARTYATLAELAASGLKTYPATVPGNFELDLHAAGVIPDPFFGLNILGLREFEHCQLWYGRRFQAQRRDGLAAQLLLEGLDCCGELYLNGHLLGRCDNMLIEHAFWVDELLQGDNELLIHIRPPGLEARKYEYPALVSAMGVHAESLYIRKAPHMYGWDIMPRAIGGGLWRPVSLRYKRPERLEEVYLETTQLSAEPIDVQRQQHPLAVRGASARLRLSYRAALPEGSKARYELCVEGRCGDSTFQLSRPVVFPAGRIVWNVENPRLWWPRGYGQADLYQVTVTLLCDGEAVDVQSFAHGIRTIELLRTSTTTADGAGQFLFKVNGVDIFCKGSNWVPADAFHSRDAARIPAMLDLATAIECNILRCWGGNVYENDLFFELCDQRGIMIWQDFAMACAVYPQDADFQARLAAEAVAVVKRLRQHACLVLWAGDNECDNAYTWHHRGDPNRNVLTRKTLPGVIAAHDPLRPFLPSSPYVDEAAYQVGELFTPEQHLWGPRDYYKSDFYRTNVCHFASEIGYHGCPSVESIRRFISPDKVWPCENNDEWSLHSTNPTLGTEVLGSVDSRVKLMLKQVRALFGQVPATLEDFAFASQAVQGEAKKYFVERFRGSKWRRTGIIWWNLIDGWPQFSDSVVDYYYVSKLAYHFLGVSQKHVCLMIREREDGRLELVAANDTRSDAPVSYRVTDLPTGKQLAAGKGVSAANQSTLLAEVSPGQVKQSMWLIEWDGPSAGKNHYLLGQPIFDLAQYRQWLAKAGLYPDV